jgi:hypothetical protein
VKTPKKITQKEILAQIRKPMPPARKVLKSKKNKHLDNNLREDLRDCC